MAIGEAIEREKLTNEEAAQRFRMCIRTVQRALLYRRKAVRLLTPDDLDVFILLAEAYAMLAQGCGRWRDGGIEPK